MQDYRHTSPFYRVTRRIAALAPLSWVLARTIHHVDPHVGRLTRGRHTLTSLVTGMDVAELTTRGARSGLPRTVPLCGFPTPEGFVVVASNFAQHSHPSWYHNLLAHPQAELEVGGQTRPVLARLTTGPERALLWDQAVSIYPGWTHYERRAAHREIGVFVLEETSITRHG
ncbi:nitroreductase family deazaflavin-dependent oxidoreductase [Angustibacter sp. McL0619]|uniref:nitroreductase family deazaflavin-dependent oxidoreductase n=1 Tax=Angustibacter sp. McL0619 TaxID=3415676 RepID=UPI003CE7533C